MIADESYPVEVNCPDCDTRLYTERHGDEHAKCRKCGAEVVWAACGGGDVMSWLRPPAALERLWVFVSEVGRLLFWGVVFGAAWLFAVNLTSQAWHCGVTP